MLRSNEMLDQADNDDRFGSQNYGNQNFPQQQQRYVPPNDRLGGTGFYGAGGSIGGVGSTGGFYGETDNKSIASTPSKISKFTYSGMYLK